MALIDGIIAYFPLDGAYDAHSNYHLTESGATAYATGIIGNGYDSGSGNTLSVPVADLGDLQPGTTDFSVSFWWKADSFPASSSGLLFYMGANLSGSNPTGLNMHVNASSKIALKLNPETTSWKNLLIGDVLSTGTWYHTVVTLDRDGDATVYLNGVSKGTLDISAWSSESLDTTEDLVIGRDYGGGNYFDGVVDEMLFYRGVLSGGDISTLYGSGTPPRYTGIAELPAISHRYVNALASNAAEITASVNGSSEWATGDLIVIFATIDGDQTSSGVTCDLSSSTQAWETAAVEGSGSVTSVCFYKEIVSGDTSTTSVEVAWTDSSEKATIEVLRIPAALHDGIDGTPVGSDEGDTDAPSSGSVTTTVDGSLLFVTEGNDGAATATRPSGTGLVVAQAADGGGLVSSAVAILRKDTAGATGAKAWTLSSSRAVVAGAIAVKAVSAGGVTGSGSLADGGETLAGTGVVVVSGSGALIDDGETIVGTGVATVAASGSLTDGGETIAGTGSVVVTGSGALVDTGETLSGAGTVGSLVSGSGGLTDGGEIISGVGLVLVSGSGSLIDGAEAIVGVGAVLVSGSGSITDSGEILSGSDQASGSVDDIEMTATPYLEITMTVEPYVE